MDLQARIAAGLARLVTAINAVDAKVGGTDPWTRVGLASDNVNATIAFVDIPGFTYTPPANTNFTIEAEVLLETVATANMPRLGVVIPAGQAYWMVDLEFQSAAGAKTVMEAQGTTGAGSVQMAAGTAIVQAIPILVKVFIKGRTGASPAAIKLQLAAETAVASAAKAKVGSEFRRRVGP